MRGTYVGLTNELSFAHEVTLSQGFDLIAGSAADLSGKNSFGRETIPIDIINELAGPESD